jgi:hypothetical protein
MWVLVGAIAGALAFWGLYLAKVLFDFDPFYHGKPRDKPGPMLMLCLAVGATLILSVWALVAIRRRQILLNRGVIVDGFVTRVGMASKAGRVPVTFVFKVGEVEYTKKIDVDRDRAHEYDFDTPQAEVLYDPDNPKRCAVLPFGTYPGYKGPADAT